MDRLVIAGLKAERKMHLKRAKDLERSIVLAGGKTGRTMKRRGKGKGGKKAKKLTAKTTAGKKAIEKLPPPVAAGNGKVGKKTIGRIISDAKLAAAREKAAARRRQDAEEATE